MSINERRVLLLIDADMVAFSCAAAVEYGKEPEEINFVEIQNAMESLMKRIIQRTNPTDVIACISGDTNMRHVINPHYKENREGVWRPENLKNAKATLMTMYNGVKKDGLEADDLMGVLARWEVEFDMGKRGLIKEINTLGPCKYDEVIIASLDKDLRQLGKPSAGAAGPKITHYQWERESVGTGEKFTTVEGFGELKCIIKDSGKTKKKEIKGSGPKFFLWQMLTGDSTDGVMGCGIQVEKMYKTGAKAGELYMRREGVGAVEAFELLDKIDNYLDGLKAIAAQYILRFGDGWEQEMVTTGRLLYMHHQIVNGHFVKLWHHKSSVVQYFDLKEKKIVEQPI